MVDCSPGKVYLCFDHAESKKRIGGGDRARFTFAAQRHREHGGTSACSARAQCERCKSPACSAGRREANSARTHPGSASKGAANAKLTGERAADAQTKCTSTEASARRRERRPSSQRRTPAADEWRRQGGTFRFCAGAAASGRGPPCSARHHQRPIRAPICAKSSTNKKSGTRRGRTVSADVPTATSTERHGSDARQSYQADHAAQPANCT